MLRRHCEKPDFSRFWYYSLRTEGAAISYILENDLDTMFATFTPDNTLVFNNGDLVQGSQTGAQALITSYGSVLLETSLSMMLVLVM